MIHIALSSLPLRPLRSLWLNHSGGTDINTTKNFAVSAFYLPLAKQNEIKNPSTPRTSHNPQIRP